MARSREARGRRGRLSRLLHRLWFGESPKRPDQRADRLRVQGLEQRQLLAGDVEIVGADVMGPHQVESEIVAAAPAAPALVAVSEAEGEPAPDLVQFAEDLAAAGVIFYGADWCPACTEQKQLFQDGSDDLPFIEVTNPDRSAGQIAIDNNITAYPTWVFPDQTRAEGVLTLQQLSDRSGVAIPQSEEPTFEDIGNQTALIGSPLHIPIDAYDPNGDALTVSVSVADPSLLEAVVITGNRSIRIDMETYGDMIFQLFEQRAPTASGRVIELAEAGFYDDIIFHRVIDDFVIQGGDPTGTGTSGSTLPDFDDDFHPDLQHNRSGVLSFAKSTDDTNNSQFFVTEVPTRFLDFNHSVFGQLIEGEDVRDAISEHAVNSSDRPTTDIAINTIEVFNDTENSLIMLRPTGSGIGSTNVTVTVSDGDGNTHSETFQVDVNNDPSNSQPFLNDVTVPDRFDPDTSADLQLSSTDVEGDAVTYSAAVATGGTGATASVDQNGLLTVTPATGFTGTVDVIATVRPGPGVVGNGANDSDNQRLTFNFEAEQGGPTAPTSVDLRASSDTGASDSDNITNAGTLAFTVDGVENGATVQLVNVQTSAVVGEAVSSGTSVTIETSNIAALGDGDYQIAARQTLNGVTSEQSSSISVTYDSTAPTSVISSANTRGNVDRLYTTDLISDEEGSITYVLTSAPSGSSINSGSGVIEWTPGTADVGDNDFTVQTTDVAGNTRSETFTVTVSGEPLAEVRLIARDSSGNEITSLSVGQDFTLEFVGIDARDGFSRDGVFALYADILFDSSVVRPSDETIERIGDFTLAPTGVFTDGLIDELGAASARTTASNEAESLIARIPFEAVAAGSVNIRSEEADAVGSEILLFGVDEQIPANDVLFGSLALTVGLDFTLSDDSITIDEDASATTINVLANDTTTGSTLQVVSVNQPTSGGAVTLDSGTVSFTPDADFNGSTVFTYVAGNSSGAQSTATVTVNVTAVNDPPTGVADSFTVVEGTSANRLDVLGNDSIAPDTGETLTVTGAQSGTGATVVVSSDSLAIDYTPATGFTGTDTFTYTVSDGTDSVTVTSTVTVNTANDPPTAVDDSFTIDEDASEDEYDLLANDTTDADNESFVIDSVGTPSQGGTARISADGLQFFYTPAPNFFGTETVSYSIRDTGGGLATGNVTFTVNAINDTPPVLDPTRTVVRGSGESLVLSLSDLPENVDGASETLTITNLGTPTAGGTARIDSDGNVLYTPPSDTFTGTDTFTYSVSDGSGTDSNGTVTINVEDFTERDVMLRFTGTQAQTLGDSVRLTGQNILGDAVDVTGQLSDTGSELAFVNLLPGEYQIEVPAIPFFTGGDEAQLIPVSSQSADGDTIVESSLGRLKPEFLSIQDWLGSAPRQSVLVAVEPGQSAVVTQASADAAATILNPSVTLNDGGTSLSIDGRDDTDSDISGSVLTSAGDVVHDRGRVGDLRLYRIDVEEVSFTPTTVSGSTTAAEGEPIVEASEDAPTAEASDGVTDGLTTEVSGEGEAVTAATGVEDVAAPILSLPSESEPEGESVVENDPPPLSSRLSSRRTLSSSSVRTTPTAAESDTTSVESEEADTEDSTSPLSAERVDRVLRRRF
ncbi:MAG: tandem-95 repeat protein [Planctomycetota bacterium]